MPIVYKTPGVYKEEIFLQPEARLPTGIPGFVGFADAIATLNNLPEGVQFPHSLSDSLKNKVRYDSKAKRLIFLGNMSAQDRDELLNLSSDLGFRQAITSLFQGAQTALIVLHRQHEFTNQFISPSHSYLAEAIAGFFENGGTRCYVVRADTTKDPKTALKDAIDGLPPLSDLDLMAVPDAMTLIPPQPDDPLHRKTQAITLLEWDEWEKQLQQAAPAIREVQQALLQHCATHGDRLAILDALPRRTKEGVKQQRLDLCSNQKEPLNGALYYPWLKNSQDYLQPNSPEGQIVKGRVVPPCGHIAGIFARCDRTRGVFKAPANEEIFDTLDLEVAIDFAIQGELNPEGINCLRVFPGRGIRVWGGRTLSLDVNWRYINVRRLFLTLGRWIDQNMLWVSFEPNSPRLWVRIQRELGAYLEGLWGAGALSGSTPAEAFYVKCDAETNPRENRESGSVVTEIGLAPASPAEFLIVRILHRAGTSEIS